MRFFQPSPRKPVKKPPSLKSKIAVSGVLLSPFLFFGASGKENPRCWLNVERVHYSTHMNDYKSMDVVKLNIASKCNVPQEYTLIEPVIFEVHEIGNKLTHEFGSQQAFSKATNPSQVKFENLFIGCNKGAISEYSGYANGTVKLISGAKIPVSGHSDKYNLVNCRIKPTPGPTLLGKP